MSGYDWTIWDKAAADARREYHPDPQRAKFLVENAVEVQRMAQYLGVWRLFRLRKMHQSKES